MTSASVSRRVASKRTETAWSKAAALNEISTEAAIFKNVLWAKIYDSRASGNGQSRPQRQVQDKDPERSMHMYMHSGMLRAVACIKSVKF